MKIAGILLTAEEYLNDKVRELCVETAEKAGLAILTAKNKSVKTILRIANIDLMGVPLDDKERIQRVKEVICNSLDRNKIISVITADVLGHQVMSPPAFRYHLLKMATKAKKELSYQRVMNQEPCKLQKLL